MGQRDRDLCGHIHANSQSPSESVQCDASLPKIALTRHPRHIQKVAQKVDQQNETLAEGEPSYLVNNRDPSKRPNGRMQWAGTFQRVSPLPQNQDEVWSHACAMSSRATSRTDQR